MKLLSACDVTIRGRGRDLFTRGGPLSPPMLVSLLLFQTRYGASRGYARMIEAFWGEAKSHGLELPREEPVTAQAFSDARTKLPPDLVRSLLHTAGEGFDEIHGERFLWRGRRLVAVDGQRRFVQPCEALRRCFGGPAGSHYPMAHVTTLFDVVSKMPRDAVVGPYGADERVQLSQVLARTRTGDVVVLDAGFPSFDVFVMLLESKLDFVARVPETGTFAAIMKFLADGGTDGDVVLHPPEGSVLRGGDPITVRVLRIPRKGDEAWVLVTTLAREEFPANVVAEAYGLRWPIETFHAALVSEHFDQGFFHAKWKGGVEQEVYAQALFVAITRHLMAAATADEEGPAYEHVSAKAALLAVGDHLARLVLMQPPERATAHLGQLLRRIARAIEKPRPGRSFPRKSLLPGPRWGPAGRRGGA